MEKKRKWNRVRNRRRRGEGEVGSVKVRFEQRLKEVRHRPRWMAGEKVRLAQRVTSAKALRQSL